MFEIILSHLVLTMDILTGIALVWGITLLTITFSIIQTLRHNLKVSKTARVLLNTTSTPLMLLFGSLTTCVTAIIIGSIFVSIDVLIIQLLLLNLGILVYLTDWLLSLGEIYHLMFTPQKIVKTLVIDDREHKNVVHLLVHNS